MEDIKWSKVENNQTIILNNNDKVEIIQNGKLTIVNILKDDIETYTHKFITSEADSIYIQPSLPELPIIIRSNSNLSILPKAKLKAYIEVPILLGIYSGSKNKKDLLLEVPTKKLSKGFLGDPETGEFSYSLESPLYLNYTDYNLNNRSVYCKISISNKTLTTMNFERMILRVPNFNIYEGNGQFFSNQESVSYIGRDVNNQMVINKLPPNIGFNLKQIVNSRHPIDSNLLKRSFYFIKNIYNT